MKSRGAVVMLVVGVALFMYSVFSFKTARPHVVSSAPAFSYGEFAKVGIAFGAGLIVGGVLWFRRSN